MSWGCALRTVGQLLDGLAADSIEIVCFPAGLLVRWGVPGQLTCAVGHSWPGIKELNDRAVRTRKSLAWNDAHRWDHLLRMLGQTIDERSLQWRRIANCQGGLWVECVEDATGEGRWFAFAELESAERERQAHRTDLPAALSEA